MNRIALAGTDLFAWMALRRVHRGYIAKWGDRYLDAGRPIPGHIAEALDALTEAGLVLLAEANPLAGRLRRATMTDSGRARYTALHEHTAIVADPPRSGTT
ncbi:MAG: hypothetical protein ACRDTG_15075 [Pseudonocardiaceae bacterium]